MTSPRGPDSSPVEPVLTKFTESDLARCLATSKMLKDSGPFSCTRLCVFRGPSLAASIPPGMTMLSTVMTLTACNVERNRALRRGFYLRNRRHDDGGGPVRGFDTSTRPPAPPHEDLGLTLAADSPDLGNLKLKHPKVDSGLVARL